ncbi:MAG: winged helix-turn-helix domain-containing protein [Candidatus Pacearchaeota archaeon]
MIFDSSENKCIIKTLSILTKEESTYSDLFRITKFSHITLQNSLKILLEKKFIQREDSKYKITDKGKNLFKKLEELIETLK